MENRKAFFDSISDPDSDERLLPLGNGLINNTFVLEGLDELFIVQSVNTAIFKKVADLENNISLATKTIAQGKSAIVPLEFLPIQDDQFHYSVNERTWRMMRTIDLTDCYEKITDPHQARNAAVALGSFHALLSEANPSDFRETIDRFTDFSFRWENFETALRTGITQRITAQSDLCDFFFKHKSLLNAYLEQNDHVPKRVIHGDPKAANFLFHNNSNTVKSIIDWDTIMPGTVLYDFGDMVRSFTNRCKEDELSDSGYFNPEIYNNLHTGYLSSPMGIKLTETEKKGMALAACTVVYIQALRFFTDYLLGDRYYKISMEDHNLLRTKNQIGLLTEMKAGLQL